MAPKKDKAAEVEATKEQATEEVDPRTKVTVLHEKHAEYIKEQTGIDVDPLSVFLVYSTRVAFRKTSEEYREVKAAKESAEEEKARLKAEAKAQREAEAAERKAEKEREAEEKAAKKAEREKEAAEKRAAKEAEAAEKKAAKEAADKAKAEAKESSDGETAKPAKGRRKGKQTSADAIKDAEASSAKSPF